MAESLSQCTRRWEEEVIFAFARAALVDLSPHIGLENYVSIDDR
jgi:hypothetical protein